MFSARFRFYSLLLLVSLFFACAKKKSKKEIVQNIQNDKERIAYLLDLDDSSRIIDVVSNDSHLSSVRSPDVIADEVESFIRKNPGDPEIAYYKVLLANLYLRMGRLVSAHELFKQIVELHPSSPLLEYAYYKTILSKYYQSLGFEFDQEVTEETIALCNSYLSENVFYEYKSDIIDIMNTCRQKLVDKEFYVYNFYLRRKNYKSAQKKLEYIRDKFAKDDMLLQARLLYLECRLEKERGNLESASEKLNRLLSDYPGTRFTRMAQSMLSKKIG